MKISPINYNPVQLSKIPQNRGIENSNENGNFPSKLQGTSPHYSYCPLFCANLNSKKSKPFGGEKSLERFNSLSEVQRDIQYEDAEKPKK